MALIDDLDLNKAFRRVDSDRRDDAWPDIVGHRDYKRELRNNVSFIQESLRSPNQYQTAVPLSIDIPKRGSSYPTVSEIRDMTYSNGF